MEEDKARQKEENTRSCHVVMAGNHTYCLKTRRRERILHEVVIIKIIMSKIKIAF